MGRSAAIVLGSFIGAVILIAGANTVIRATSSGTAETPMTLVLSLVIGATIIALAAYVAASMARERPTAHALAVGGLKVGLILAVSLAGPESWAAAPPWFHLLDCLIALPAAWLGGQFVRLRRSPSF